MSAKDFRPMGADGSGFQRICGSVQARVACFGGTLRAHGPVGLALPVEMPLAAAAA